MSNIVAFKATDDIAPATLTALVDRAAKLLSGVRTAAVVLEAREVAGAASDLAKRQARIERKRKARDEIVRAYERIQGDALEVRTQADTCLAVEYHAAQADGLVAKHGQRGSSKKDLPDGKVFSRATAADLGLSHKEIHEARIISDAEKSEPGFTKRIIEEMLAAGHEPLRSRLLAAARRKLAELVSQRESVGAGGECVQPEASAGSDEDAGAAAMGKKAQLARLQVEAPDLANAVQNGKMTLAEAFSRNEAQQRERAHRLKEAREAGESLWRDISVRLGMIEHGAELGERYVLPARDRELAESVLLSLKELAHGKD